MSGYSAQTEEQKRLPYLSKRIFAEKQNDILINFTPLRAAMREYVNSLPDKVGVYFEYLPSGNSVGVNEKMEVVIASLIKTPLVMAVYKELEKGTVKKTDKITLSKAALDPNFGDLWKQGEGSTITVEEAIDYALKKSDNTAANALLAVAPEKTVHDVFDSLDISTSEADGKIMISAKNYSSILRSLYLSSFLTKASSNEILDLLTQTDFDSEIVAGVPSSIKVAHKVGVQQASNVYNDCGIIYVPERPYLLCVVVQAEQTKSSEYMRHLSKMIYGYIVAVKGKN
jgi:beta-lactamase class A